MNIRKKLLVSIGLALYFSLSGFLALSTMEYAELQQYANASKHSIVLGLLLTFIHFCVYLYVLQSTSNTYSKKFFLGALINLLSTLVLSFLVYQDLFRSIFHILGAFLLIFIFKFSYFTASNKSILNTKILVVTLIILEIGVTSWVLLHAFFGVLLKAAFAQKWMIFNAYTAGYLFIGLFAIKEASSYGTIIVEIQKNAIRIGNNNISNLFSKKDLLLLWLLTKINTPECNSITCSEVVRAYSEYCCENENNYQQCQNCLEAHYKATVCKQYKLIYNQILKIKKILETFLIGTIIQPDNKMHIKEEGWKFVPFKNVKIMHT